MVRVAVKARLLALAVVALVFAGALAGSAQAKTTWLCKPGMKGDPCTPSLRTTAFSNRGSKLRVENVKAAKAPKIDCFYVYPTVSDQPGQNANLTVDPVERSIALYQAARYSQVCRVFAPMYRQGTIGGLGGGGIAAAYKIAYADVLAAWKDYLAHFNHGRPFVLIGHSQGTFHLRKLLSQQIDPKPALRKRLISAILLGGNVLVKKGKDVGGDFKHVAACRSDTQLGCVVAFSSFDQVPPADSKFGRSATAGLQVLCTNPASLHGGSAALDAIEPTQPFAPGSIALGIQLLQLTLPKASTPWLEVRDAFKGHCSTAGGATFLSLFPQGASPTPKPSPDPTWGLHLVDGNIALGNLVSIVQSEAAAYAATG
jgi:hypothetical protein